MRILGIDPGYATIGFGVLEAERGSFRLERYGTITTSPDQPFSQRLLTIYEDMNQLIDTVAPDVMAIEELFWGHNITTGIGVSHGRGVILLSAAQRQLPVFEYTPMQIKQAVTGYGKAVKKQIQEMTRILLHLPEIPRPDDTADALAMAVAHCHCAGNRLSRLPGVSRQASDRER